MTRGGRKARAATDRRRCPAARPLAPQLWFHGGSFAYGSVRTHGELAAGARALVPEYRLAPERPFRPLSWADGN